MFLRQGNVDESLMHSKGIVDLALFSSGIHILTLKVLLLSSKNVASMDESKGRSTTSPPGMNYFEDSTQQSVKKFIIKVSHSQAQTILYVTWFALEFMSCV